MKVIEPATGFQQERFRACGGDVAGIARDPLGMDQSPPHAFRSGAADDRYRSRVGVGGGRADAEIVAPVIVIHVERALPRCP